jgi:hypothetical protein
LLALPRPVKRDRRHSLYRQLQLFRFRQYTHRNSDPILSISISISISININPNFIISSLFLKPNNLQNLSCKLSCSLSSSSNNNLSRQQKISSSKREEGCQLLQNLDPTLRQCK